MKLSRYGDGRLGVALGEEIADISGALKLLPHTSYPYPAYDMLISRLDEVVSYAQEHLAGADRIAADTPLAAPVANPGKIVAAPVNYMKHLEEVRDQAEIHNQNEAHMRQIQEVGLFLKATSSLIGPSDRVQIGKRERRNDHEIELVAVIGREAKNVAAADALSYVAGYCVGLDMTVRGPEERSLRKSLDTYSVIGPWLVTADEIPDPSGLDMILTVNGHERQRANTRDLVMSVPQLIEYASSYYTLYPGDILFTGTPEGVGPVEPGDRMVATISKVGSITVDID